MKIKLYKHEEMLFALLRSSLTQNAADVSVFEGATPEEWRKCYLLAQDHGVKALAWDGVVTLPSEKRPPKQLYLNWALAVEKYEKQYEHYCRTIAKLTDFFAQHGILTMQMKGVGFSTYYPHPEHREGGDLDIFTSSADASVMSDKEANDLADKLIQQQGIDVELTNYKHTEFFYDGVPVENHKYYLNVESMKMAIPVENALKKVNKPVKTSLLNGEYNIYIPSDEFNTLHIPFHAIQHFVGGVTMHHLCDWACILNRCGMEIPSELTDKRFHRDLAMFNSFASRFLGCEAPTSCSEDDLDLIFWIVMRSNNEYKIVFKNPITRFFKKISRLYVNLKLRKELAGRPILPSLLEIIYMKFQ